MSASVRLSAYDRRSATARQDRGLAGMLRRTAAAEIAAQAMRTRQPIIWDALLLAALLTDIGTPFPIWKGALPGALRWVSHASLAAALFLVYVEMMLKDKIPPLFWVIPVMTAISASTAYFRGQGMVATLWGWWNQFQYPMVCVYAYMVGHWSPSSGRRIRNLCIGLMVVEVVVQVMQYMTGQRPGDNLGGLFGQRSTDALVLFITFAVCISAGHWMASGNSLPFMFSMGLGAVSSTLGEMKLFFGVCFAITALVALTCLLLRSRRVRDVLVPVFGLALLLYGMIVAYNVVVPLASRFPIESYLERDVLEEYLTRAERTVYQGSYTVDLGRNYAVGLGWDYIRQEWSSLVFGIGIGARGESRSLGISGSAIAGGGMGRTSGTGLLVMMQELGMGGLSAFGLFLAWVVARMIKGLRTRPDSPATDLRLCIIYFTLFWPLWLWYANIWQFRVPMLFYWASLGITLSIDAQEARAAPERAGASPRPDADSAANSGQAHAVTDDLTWTTSGQ